MLNEATRLFIESHLNDDIRQLALKKMSADVDKLLALSQIEARQTLMKKVPSWASNPDLMFPKHLSLEQCSSELTARYKKSIIESYRKINPQSQIVETVHAPSDCETESKTEHAPSVQSDADGLTSTFVDLTGGLGVDSYFLSENFNKAYYVENQKDLCDLAEHNFKVLGRKITVVNADAESVMDMEPLRGSGCVVEGGLVSRKDPAVMDVKSLCDFLTDKNASNSWYKSSCNSWFYLDPARRDAFNRKMVSLHDCSPDVVALQDKMLSLAEHILIKVSPMLDISVICSELKNIKEIHVVSVKNECKEVLVLLERGFSDRIKFICVNIVPNVISTVGRNLLNENYSHFKQALHDGQRDKSCCNESGTSNEFLSTLNSQPSTLNSQPSTLNSQLSTLILFADDEKNAVPIFADTIGKYLYEPNSSLMKAGVFKLVSERFGIKKLHVNSHLYTSDNLIPDFPGRVFEVIGFSNFDKKVKKELLKDVTKASVVTRNFPLSANDLRKSIALQESDDIFVFGTTMKGERKVVVLGKKVIR